MTNAEHIIIIGAGTTRQAYIKRLSEEPAAEFRLEELP
jgi:hypothetical protein